MNKNTQTDVQTDVQTAPNTASIIISEEYNNLSSISASIDYLNHVQNNVDYAKSIMYYALSRLPVDSFTALNVSYDVTTKKKDGTYETKSVQVDSYVKYCYYKWSDSQSYVSKMVRVADRFMETNNTPLLETHSVEDKDGKKHDLITANISGTVNVKRKDKYGFKFSLSALAEMLRFSDEQLNTAIEEDIIDSSTPCSKVREILEKRFKKVVETTATETGDGVPDTDNVSGTTPTETDNYVCEKTDLSRLTVIQTILNSLSDNFKNTHEEQVKTMTKTISLAINEMTK